MNEVNEPQPQPQKKIHIVYNKRQDFWHVFVTGELFTSDYSRRFKGEFSINQAETFAKQLQTNTGYRITYLSPNKQLTDRHVYVTKHEERAIKYALSLINGLDMSKPLSRISDGRLENFYQLQKLLKKCENLPSNLSDSR